MQILPGLAEHTLMITGFDTQHRIGKKMSSSMKQLIVAHVASTSSPSGDPGFKSWVRH
jgi:hypothetical protein